MSCPNCGGRAVFSGRCCIGTCVYSDYSYAHYPDFNDAKVINKGKQTIDCGVCKNKHVTNSSRKYFSIHGNYYSDICCPYLQNQINKKMNDFSYPNITVTNFDNNAFRGDPILDTLEEIILIFVILRLDSSFLLPANEEKPDKAKFIHFLSTLIFSLLLIMILLCVKNYVSVCILIVLIVIK
jgi:hypothetical protein